MAENVDSQLKQMSSDLKMIIEQMNKSNTSSDDDNPVSYGHHYTLCVTTHLHSSHTPRTTHTVHTDSEHP